MIATMELQTGVLSTLTEWDPHYITLKQYDVIVATITDLLSYCYGSMADSVCHAPSVFQ